MPCMSCTPMAFSPCTLWGLKGFQHVATNARGTHLVGLQEHLGKGHGKGLILKPNVGISHTRPLARRSSWVAQMTACFRPLMGMPTMCFILCSRSHQQNLRFHSHNFVSVGKGDRNFLLCAIQKLISNPISPLNWGITNNYECVLLPKVPVLLVLVLTN